MKAYLYLKRSLLKGVELKAASGFTTTGKPIPLTDDHPLAPRVVRVVKALMPAQQTVRQGSLVKAMEAVKAVNSEGFPSYARYEPSNDDAGIPSRIAVSL